MKQNNLVSICLSVIALLATSATCELFTAIVDLQKILYAENSIASDLKAYIAEEEKRIQKLKDLAADYESHSAEALANPEKHFANPVNAFLLVKRFTTDWEHVLDTFVRTNASIKFMQKLEVHTDLFPSDDDLEGAAQALMRLQDTYALPTEKIARGDLHGIDTSPILTAEECFELGRHAYLRGDYYHTVLWMQQALELLEEEQQQGTASQSSPASPSDSHAPSPASLYASSTSRAHGLLNARAAVAGNTRNPRADSPASPGISRGTILDHLAYGTAMQGNLEHALELTKELLAFEPTHERAINNLNYYNHMLQSQSAVHGKGDAGSAPQPFQNKRIMDEYRQSEEFARYEALCRTEDVMEVYRAHELTCQYKRHHPLFYIDPLKEETVSFKPWVALYHDLISEKEMAIVKALAIPKLNRATVQNPTTGRLEFANYRVSKSAWLKDDEDAVIRRVSMRTNALTNLTLQTVEELQVVNYGIGGHYEPHFDFARPEEKNTFEEWRGNRILTVMFYMSEVLSGGWTVFPQVGVKVPPVKGAAAVWYNLLANGEGDYSTRHAGCPVLTGQKWVANKWFHIRGQEFARPCELDPAL